MRSNAAKATACKHCEKPLPENHSGRICPACLMAEALEVSEVLDTGSLEEMNPELSRESTIPDFLEGTTIGLDGRYKILQRIGEGGFGTVYMAEQSKPVRRRIAVKILKAGMDTRQFVARFEAERQALAMMDHPNIARIIDGGESRQGRPFLVMELVRGIPITTFCDEENFGTGQRLDLFIKVCRAVQHAHQKGIIHRDLKPGNILVTVEDGAEPVPKVIDFGVAKAADTSLTDKTLFTRFEQMIGTPAYMSPEQAGAQASHDVDTRADIYALGVLLYELLTGTTPIEEATLKGAAFDEVRRILREDEAPRPSARLSSLELDRRTTIAKSRDTQSATLGRQLRGDLDWIVMKAIEKDRRRRYDTANALAADVERHLDDEPVSAGPPTAAYRTGKFLRRHKTTVAVAAAMVLLLVAGIATSSWQAIRATAEKRRATEEKQHAVESEALAEERQKEAESISEFIIGIFESSKPGEVDGGRTVTVAESLKTAEKKLEEDEDFPAERRAILQHAIAGVYESLGQYRDAMALREKVVQFYNETHGSECPDTLKAMQHLAGSIHNAGRPDEALVMREEVLALCRKVLGSEHADTLSAMNNLALSLRHAGRPDDVVWAMQEEVVDLRRKELGPEHPDTLKAMFNLVLTYADPDGDSYADADADRLDQALAMGEKVLELCRKVLSSEESQTLTAIRLLATLYDHAGRQDEALALREEVLALRSKSFGPEHPDTLKAILDLSISYSTAGRHGEALTLREGVLKGRRMELGPEHPDTLKAMKYLAFTYADVSEQDKALAMREELVKLSRKVRGSEDVETIGAIHELASSYTHAGRQDEVLALREEVLELCRKVLGSEHPYTLNATGNLADAYGGVGRRDEALEMHERVLALKRKLLGPEHPYTIIEMINLPNYYRDAGRLDEELKMREQAVLLSRKVNGEHHSHTRGAMMNLAESYETASRLDEALTMREEVLKLSRKANGPEHPDTLTARNSLAVTYEIAGRENDAFELRGFVNRPLRADSPAVTALLIPPTSEWRWLHPIDGIDPAEAAPEFHRIFFRTDFDDSAWQRGTDSEDGTGGFGYGDEGFTGVDIGTPAEKPLGKSAYFRHRFTTVTEFTKLELRCHRDDGIIVYLDGKEVGRDNMSEGEEAYRLPAASTVGGSAETAVFRLPLRNLTLPTGEHVLAISLHNTEAPSSDLRIGGITLVEVE